jgi:hypothetical protein
MKDTGLAQIGDNLVNLCYSLAKSVVLGHSCGEKVRDSVLARAIRSSTVYSEIGRRTDAGTAGDAYEAIVAYAWLKGDVTIETLVGHIIQHLQIDKSTSRKQEDVIASKALESLIEETVKKLSDITKNRVAGERRAVSKP